MGEYGSDPEGPPTFNNYSDSNDFFDVSVASDSSFEKLVATVCGLDGDPDAMWWWDTAAAAGSGGWEPVAPIAAVSSLKPGCLTTTITGTTSPSVTELSGTVFGVALRLAPQRVSFATPGPSSAVVGGTYKPAATPVRGCRSPSVSTPPRAKARVRLLRPARSCSPALAHAYWTPPRAEVPTGRRRWLGRDIDVLGGKPVAAAANYSTPTGHALRVMARNGVLAKGSVNGATISSHTSPSHGTLTLLGDGAFTYVPRPSFSGTDHFTYTLRNSLGRSTGTVSIEVRDLGRGRDVAGKSSSPGRVGRATR